MGCLSGGRFLSICAFGCFVPGLLGCLSVPVGRVGLAGLIGLVWSGLVWCGLVLKVSEATPDEWIAKVNCHVNIFHCWVYLCHVSALHRC